MDIIIIGAGAAGCFAGIEVKRLLPEARVTIIERGKRPLAKVAITGGGRCNLTNSFALVRSMDRVYPRGHRLMKKLFHHFSHRDAYRWFEDNGVKLVTQDDECVFPASQDAMEIVDTLLGRLRESGVRIFTETRAELIRPLDDGTYAIDTNRATLTADRVLVTTGGQPTGSGYAMLRLLDVDIVESRPSLFSFCIDDERLRALMGTVVKEAGVSLSGTKLRAEGALLITHWGISGPAVLKLSSYAARTLADQGYAGEVAVRWLTDDHESILDMLTHMADAHRDKHVSSIYPTAFNARLWAHLLQRASIATDMRWKDIHNKDLNRLLNVLTNDVYRLTGKNRFKDEFVTSGGVSLTSLHAATLEAKSHPGLFFAGEVTDVDAITGGFNLQAAWTMGYVAANAMVKNRGEE